MRIVGLGGAPRGTGTVNTCRLLSSCNSQNERTTQILQIRCSEVVNKQQINGENEKRLIDSSKMKNMVQKNLFRSTPN